MKKLLFAAFFLLFVGLALVPAQAEAQGLVPCGGDGQPACTFCHTFSLLKNILDIFLFPTVPIIAALLIAIGGFFLFTGAASPQNLNRGRTIIFAVVIGLLIIYSSWLFINLLLDSLGVTIWTGPGTWFEIDCPIPVPPAIAHWKFDENAGSTAFDSIGNNNGTLFNGPTWVPGKISSALEFDGTDDYVDAGAPSAFNFGDGTTDKPFTIAAWIKRSGAGSKDVIVSKYNSNATRQQYTFELSSAGDLDFTLFDTSNDRRKGIKTTAFITDTLWHHVAAVYDGTAATDGPLNSMDLYIDGALQAVTVSIDHAAYAAMEATTESLKIGKLTNVLDDPELFHGLIDDVKVWNVPLRPEEVSAEFSSAP